MLMYAIHTPVLYCWVVGKKTSDAARDLTDLVLPTLEVCLESNVWMDGVTCAFSPQVIQLQKFLNIL